MGKEVHSFKVMHGPAEVAGQNYYSVRGLRRIGIDAESVVYSPHLFGYPYDKSLNVYVSRKLYFPQNVLKRCFFFLEACKRYDILHFHYGQTICQGLDLPFYNLLNISYFIEFHGSDIRDTRFSIGLSGEKYGYENIQSLNNRRYSQRICKHAKGIILHDDELISHVPDTNAPVYVVPLRIDPNNFQPVYPKVNNNETIRVVHAPSRRAGKGTSFIIETIEKLRLAGANLELVLVEGKGQEEAKRIFSTADIIIDQLLAGTYGVFSIESMALGKPVIAFIADEMKHALPKDLPIVSAKPETLADAILALSESAEKRYELGVSGRRYIETYHDYRNVAYMLRDLYCESLEPLTGRDAFAYVKAIAENNGL